MEIKTLHIAPALSVTSCIRSSLHNFEGMNKVIHCPVHLSCTPLPKDYSDRELFRTTMCYQDIKVYDALLSFVNIDFNQYDRIIVWHGDVASELLMLYMVADLVDYRKLYEIDLTDSVDLTQKVACDAYAEQRDGFWKISMGEIRMSDVEEYELHLLLKKTSVSDSISYRRLWQEFRALDVNYIFNRQNGKLTGYPDDFMDEAILESCKQCKRFILTVADVLNRFSYLDLNDTAIINRIHTIQKKLIGTDL